MVTDDAVAVLRAHGTCAVSDALDMLGLGATGLSGLVRQSGIGTGTVAGPAYTLRFDPVEPGQPGPAGEFIDAVPPGAVVTVAGGHTHCTVWGDLLALTAVRNGVAGTVIDGMCRDVGAIRETGYPLWSLGSYMKSGKHRVRLAAIQEPVTLRGTRVRPGDLVVCDDSGCLTVPPGALDDVAATVLRIDAAEREIRADLAAGAPLRQARARTGYNTLGLVRP